MQAWVLDRTDGALTFGLQEIERPTPGTGEILVRVSACGLCRTDIHIVREEIELPRLPIVPGHQIVGTVIDGGGRFPAGARVGVAWLHETCGACADCARDDENLCRGARFTGYHVQGGMAEYVTVPEAFAYALPESLSDAQAAPLLCAGIVGYRARRQADVGPVADGRREIVGLYGFGSSAHIALQVVRHWGHRVFVVTRGARHRALARDMGADWVGSGSDAPPEPMDRAVVFAPAGELIPQALRAVRWGGTVASAAIHMSAIPEMDYARDLFGERTLRSTTASTRRDGEALLAIAAEGAIKTHVTQFAFDDCTEGLDAIAEDRLQGSAVLRVRAIRLR